MKKIYKKTAKAEVIQILISISLALEKMQHIFIKPWRSLGPCCRKKR